MRDVFSRRHCLRLAGAAAVFGATPLAAEEEPVELTWQDLAPEQGGLGMETLMSLGVVEHGQADNVFGQQKAANVTREYDGKRVRLPGYVVPLDFSGTGVTSFLLVPYVGACIHVPPPPPNQLVFVTTETPYEDQGLFNPVWVTGLFGAAATKTQLADVGYAMTADEIEPYG